jgi:hypothetical protein
LFGLLSAVSFWNLFKGFQSTNLLLNAGKNFEFEKQYEIKTTARQRPKSVFQEKKLTGGMGKKCCG